jgi:hypothetical protein
LVSGARLHFQTHFDADAIRYLWRAEISGAFLDSQAAANFCKEIQRSPRVLLPELPSMVPGSSLRLLIYGAIYGKPEVNVTVPENTWRVDTFALLKEGLLTKIVTDRFWLGYTLFVLATLRLVALSLLTKFFTRR